MILHPNHHNAFVLPVIMLLSAGLFVLLIALSLIVDLERKTAAAYIDIYQAELAVESAFAESELLLTQIGSTDSYIIAEMEKSISYDDDRNSIIIDSEDGITETEAGERGRPYLYAIQGQKEGESLQYQIVPLFSTAEPINSLLPRPDGGLDLPEDQSLKEALNNDLESLTTVRGTPYRSPPVITWRTIYNQDGIPIARHAYWIEDMQAYLDSSQVTGNNHSGDHQRANENWPEHPQSWNQRILPIMNSYIAKGGRAPLWPAPGINPAYRNDDDSEDSLLNQIAVFALDRKSFQTTDIYHDQSSLDDSIRAAGKRALTPASLLPLIGISAPLQRVSTGIHRGRLELTGNEIEGRLIEENFISQNRPWKEHPVIPFIKGIEVQSMGLPQLNLNKFLNTEDEDKAPLQRELSIEQMAEFIDSALPRFATQRQGGFPENYLQTIAANALDYADQDHSPSYKEGHYRGIDSQPLISEYLMTTSFEWLKHPEDSEQGQELFLENWIYRTETDTYLLFTVELFAELWNMSNYPISGSAQARFENAYQFTLSSDVNKKIGFMGDVLANQNGPASRQSWSIHNLHRDEPEQTYYTAPSPIITIPPNGYSLVRLGAVRYGLLAGDQNFFLLPNSKGEPHIQNLSETEGNSGYQLKWNNAVVDRTGGQIARSAKPSLIRRDRFTRAQVCGTWGGHSGFSTGMHDPRQSWWAGLHGNSDQGAVSENSYPNNYSPGRRNVRYGSLRWRPQLPYARCLPSEWPDGGHDSQFDVASFKAFTSPHRSNPRPDQGRDGRALTSDVGNFAKMISIGQKPNIIARSKAPMFHSNLGIFISETELGNVFDPIMWAEKTTRERRTFETWTYTEANQNPEGEQEISRLHSKPSLHVGGGNTLRIGRPEHGRFGGDATGEHHLALRASRLLDLFHSGMPFSEEQDERDGPLIKIAGHLNINTASREVLRTLIAGVISSDPEIATSGAFDRLNDFAPETEAQYGRISSTDAASSHQPEDEGGLIVDAIIANRPFLARSQLADLRYQKDHPIVHLRDRPVFGNKANHSPSTALQRNDRAAEEVFARAYNSSTVRSRNFRIHVIGQSLGQTPSGILQVKATRKKTFRVFVNPGERRQSDGAILPENVTVEILYQRSL